MTEKHPRRLMKFLLPLIMLVLAVLLVIITLNNRRYKQSRESYPIPDVTLIDQDRQLVSLRDYLATDKPIVLQFIYTGCTTVCPVMLVKFANLQRRLEPDTEQLLLISISVDPENDTPEVLAAYRNNFQAQPGWDFFTGTLQDIRTVMAAFNTRPTDMATLDSPVLLRAPGSLQWLRLTGEIDSETLWQEVQQLLPKP